MKTIQEVSENQLCTGCGVCAHMEPDRFKMVDTYQYGRRPILVSNAKNETGDALKACPGISLEHQDISHYPINIKSEYFSEWGPIIAVWEGYAIDNEIRFAGSSGGAASALSLYCVEKLGMAGVLHTEMDEEKPYLNKTAFSSNQTQILSRTGSRYSSASPCDSLKIIEDAENQSVFVGKPCDVAAVQKARKLRPNLDKKIGLTIGFFCAGVPSPEGLFALLSKNGIKNHKQLKSLRFRGNGWPGHWKADYIDENGHENSAKLTYAESWGFLQKYRQWRCYICPDHTGEFADIAVGDPWYREVQEGEAGKSLIIARTQKGYEIIQQAAKAGYIKLETQDETLLPKSQPNLYKARGILWGRILALKLLMVKTPTFKGFSMFSIWFYKLGLIDKIRSISGTTKRIFVKKLGKKVSINEWSN